jgi:nitrosocyanin
MMVGVIGVLAVVGAAAYFSFSSSSNANPSPAPATTEERVMAPGSTTHSETTTPSASPTTGATTGGTTTTTENGVVTINLEAGSFYYKPDQIKVKKGDKVKLVMTSKDMMHDFVIDELGVKLPITKAGSTNTVEFTASEAGTFEFYCSVGQHRAQGQVGTLIVE